jgi:glycosyltransferase involved in cell wall biosynthesis
MGGRESAFGGSPEREGTNPAAEEILSPAADHEGAVVTDSNGATSGDDGSAETTVLVGLPAYNEEIAIGTTVLTAREFADEVVVVDDGSGDRTAEVAAAAEATVLRHESNRGKGRAIRTLFEYANDRDPSVVVVLDADGQHVPGDIPDVVDPVLDGEADIAIGSRYLDGRRTETPRYRRVGQRVLDRITPGSGGRNLSDTQSGFRAFSPRALDELRVTTDGIGVESEVVSEAASKDLELAEVPISVRYEGIDGQTYNPLSHGLAVVMFVLDLIRDRHPLVFFTLPGLALVFLGTLYGLDGVLIYRNTGVLYPAKLFVSGFLTIIGSLAAFMGLMLNSLADKFDRIASE